MADLFYTFFDFFEKNEHLLGISSLIKSPSTAYDSLSSNEPHFPWLVNFADASVFRTSEEAHQASLTLAGALLVGETFTKRYPFSLAHLIQAKDGQTFTLPDKFQHFLPFKPWYPFRYREPLGEVKVATSKVPLIFLEPLSGNFSQLAAQIDGRPCLFVVKTRADFFHMLQYKELEASLLAPEHALYILEIHPEEQNLPKYPALEPILCFQDPFVLAALPQIVSALSEQRFDALYQVARHLLFCLEERRLGMSRTQALFERTGYASWNDPYKANPLQENELLPRKIDFMGQKLTDLSKNPFIKTGKKRLVHIVPQLIDGGHAPSKLVENLICHHDRSQYDLYLVCTERMQFHPVDYPYTPFNSRPSTERASWRLKLFDSLGVSIKMLNPHRSSEDTARELACFLRDIAADFAIFHGPDSINCMAAALTSEPCRVLFEHGTPPQYPCFDLAIVSAHSAKEIYKDLYDKLHIEVASLPFQVDARAEWDEKAFAKEAVGFPPNAKICTTISNHLASRLGRGMCDAVARILQRVENCYYAPIGSLTDEEKQKLTSFFDKYNLQDRVRFVGPVKNPSQYARTMDLYLNEFPFGSGIAILDAMAAGCPIVTMYDTAGPPQARYGGDYFGIERAVTSCKPEEYIDLACKLLKDPAMHKEWQDHARQRYEKYSNPVGYVKAFEEILKLWERQKGQ